MLKEGKMSQMWDQSQRLWLPEAPEDAKTVKTRKTSGVCVAFVAFVHICSRLRDVGQLLLVGLDLRAPVNTRQPGSGSIFI